VAFSVGGDGAKPPRARRWSLSRAARATGAAQRVVDRGVEASLCHCLKEDGTADVRWIGAVCPFPTAEDLAFYVGHGQSSVGRTAKKSGCGGAGGEAGDRGRGQKRPGRCALNARIVPARQRPAKADSESRSSRLSPTHRGLLCGSHLTLGRLTAIAVEGNANGALILRPCSVDLGLGLRALPAFVKHQRWGREVQVRPWYVSSFVRYRTNEQRPDRTGGAFCFFPTIFWTNPVRRLATARKTQLA
jgi:hypothetical protein